LQRRYEALNVPDDVDTAAPVVVICLPGMMTTPRFGRNNPLTCTKSDVLDPEAADVETPAASRPTYGPLHVAGVVCAAAGAAHAIVRMAKRMNPGVAARIQRPFRSNISLKVR